MNKKKLTAAITNTLTVLHGGQPVELMYMGPNEEGKEVRAVAYFTDYAAAAKLAADTNACGNIFVNLNTFVPWSQALFETFIKEAAFLYPDKATEIRAVNGEDIEKYRWLLVDVDPIRMDAAGTRLEHVSATDEEAAAAKAMAEDIRAYLTNTFAFPDPVFCCSGNGWHLLYRIDIPGSKENLILVKTALQALADKFNTPDAKAEVDTSVYKLPQLTKLYGTTAVKGEDTPDRPHRLSFIEFIPDPVKKLTVDKLKKLAKSKTGAGKKNAGSSGDTDEEEDKQRQWLREFLTDANVYLNSENDQPMITLAKVPPDKPDTYCILSDDFKARLAAEYQSVIKDVTQPLISGGAITNLKYTAINSGRHERVFKRVAQLNDKHIVYDLNNGKGDVVDVTEAAVTISKRTDSRYQGLHFYAHTNMLPQVLPDFTGTATLPELLDPFLPFSEDDKKLVIVWLLCAMLEDTKKCILVAVGPEGSGKSSACRVLRSLIDPQSNPPGTLPYDEQNLCLSLGNRYCTLYDNVRTVSNKVSDILCQATQGGSYETRTLYTNMGLTYVSFKSTLMMNGILPSMVSSPDLKDRCLMVTATISDDQRELDGDLDALFEQRRPAILGQMFTTIQQAMALPDTEQTDYKTRMQHYASWGYLFSKILWGDGDILINAYQTNKGGLISSSLLEDPTGVGPAFICYLQGFSAASFPMVLSSQTFYNEVCNTARTSLNINTQYHPWPQSASKFTDKLRILVRSLEAFGIRLVRRKTNKAMQITIFREETRFAKLPTVQPVKPDFHPKRSYTTARPASPTANKGVTNANVVSILADDADD